MPKRTSSKIPDGAMVIQTYEQLHTEVDAFAHGERNLLIVIGPAGTAKSTAVRQMLPDARIIQGGATPYRLYQELYQNKDRDFVLDDADKVFRDQKGVFLLKIVTQTQKVKTLQWNSSTAEIRSKELLAEFDTTSRVMIVANSWPRENPDIEAIESRGHLVYFRPSNAEMHRYAGTFDPPPDPEVYSYIGENLGFLDSLDLRLYYKAAEVRTTGQRRGNPGLWMEFIKAQMMSTEKRVALNLIRDESYASDNQRGKEFARVTGQSSRHFFRLRDELILRQPELDRGRNSRQAVRAG